MTGQMDPSTRDEIRRILGRARRRWRLRALVRGAAVVLPMALAAVIASSLVLERLAFAPGWITALRIATYVVVVGAALRFLVFPQLRRLTDARVALYLEENEPVLDAVLVSAVEAGGLAPGAGAPGAGAAGAGAARGAGAAEAGTADAGAPGDVAPGAGGAGAGVGVGEGGGVGGGGSGGGVGAGWVGRLGEQAVERVREVEGGARIGRRQWRVAVGGVVATGVVACLLFLFGPAYLRHGATAVLFPWRQAEAAVPYRITVEPGDTTVARGADALVRAVLHGFATGEADLVVRTVGGTGFERVPMVPGADSLVFEAVLFDLEEAAEYFVEAGGVRSPVFRIGVADLPYASRIDHEYRFPAYTGHPPRTVEDAGAITALRGTEVRFRVWTTVPTPTGRIVLDDGRSFELVGEAAMVVGAVDSVAGEAAAPWLAGAIPIDRAGHYRIELLGPDGRWLEGSPRHAIDVVEDLPPTVGFEKPGRDTRASSIDEVFLEARATDDHGVARLELVYAVNGGEERVVELYGGGGRPLREVAAGHTLYLEELDLEPGDFIAYYARVADNRAIGERQEARSDLYFIRIRPFHRDYRAAEQRGGMQGGGMQDDGELSDRQREIIAATFNLVRDRERYVEAEWGEHVTTVTLAQSRLREEVETLVMRMRTRGILSADSAFVAIVEHLDAAAAEMKAAETRLSAREPGDALPPEQRALQRLQRAEEVYREVQVALGEEPMGGGGGMSPEAEDLADLFELEMDRLRNQYESVRRGREEQRDARLDETLERLKELARRQEQAAERQRRLARERQGGAAGAGADAQRRLADEVEEEARRLERLAREEPQQGRALEESARRLREAADAIRRSAADPSGAGAQAAADRLAEARRLLERDRTDRLVRGAEEALRRAERLAKEQLEIADDVERLGVPGPDDAEELGRLLERKDRLHDDVAALERELDRLAAEATREGLDAADRLRDAATGIRDDKLKEKVRYSKGLVQAGVPDDAAALEEEIAEDLDALRERLAQAAAEVAAAGEAAGREADALDRARRLARGMESFGERLGERMEGAAMQRQGEGGTPGEPATRAEAAGGAGGRAGGERVTLSPEEIRQFRNEARERIAEAEALRQELQRQGIDARDLAAILEAMRALDNQRVYADAAEIDRLRTQVVEGLKRFEFALRRQLRGADADRIFVPGAGQVPAGYEEWVAEYYRALGRGGG